MLAGAQVEGYESSDTSAVGSLNLGPAVAVPVTVAIAVGVGGAATTGTEPVDPDARPVEAEIQQLLLGPVCTYHQLLSVLRPVIGRYVFGVNDVILSYTVPGPERQFAPTSTIKTVPLGVADCCATVGRGADVAVLAAKVGGGVDVLLGVGVGPACSVAANAVTVSAAA